MIARDARSEAADEEGLACCSYSASRWMKLTAMTSHLDFPAKLPQPFNFEDPHDFVSSSLPSAVPSQVNTNMPRASSISQMSRRSECMSI